ncbi:hypothetical protein [Vibrio furnissii]|uniref:hypothetical protein n=1 Tax=Vibrio furnissii TaxID=29494 RepID=UPI003AA96415
MKTHEYRTFSTWLLVRNDNAVIFGSGALFMDTKKPQLHQIGLRSHSRLQWMRHYICANFDSNRVNLFSMFDQAPQKLAFSATFARV